MPVTRNFNPSLSAFETKSLLSTWTKPKMMSNSSAASSSKSWSTANERSLTDLVTVFGGILYLERISPLSLWIVVLKVNFEPFSSRALTTSDNEFNET